MESATTTSKPYVSVLIDTYNHECFIEQAITSVLGQDMPMDDVEIVVVDDGSTDRTPEIVRRFEPRLRLVRKSNGGQASAFNAAIPECRGEIIVFLDGDDWWAPQKLRCVLEAFEQDPEVGIIGNGIIQVYPTGEEHSEVLLEKRRFRIDSVEGARIFRRRKSQLGTSRMAVRAEILRKILPLPESIVIEADEFIFTLAAALSIVLILGESLTFYRIHGGNLFQLAGLNEQTLQRKRKSLERLVPAISEKLSGFGLPKRVVKAVTGSLQAEADLARLQLAGGYPWETVRAEWNFYRVVYEDGPLSHKLFKLVSLVPALFCSPRLYFKLRRKFGTNSLFLRARRVFLPIPEPRHVTRSRRYSA